MNDHLRQQWRARITAAQEEWRGRHQPSFGPPIHNLTEPENEEHDWSAPDDIYEHAHYYGDGNTDSDKESTAVMRRARAGGAEHPVTIYRAAPRGVTHIGHGDWVTPSKSYAKGHSLHETDEDKDWPVYKATVPAKHVRWAGDSINEYGYFGPPVKAEIHDPGGPNAESVRAAHTSALTHLAAEWMYHHTPKENRESIREQGLRPSNPYDPSIHELGPEQAPEGVYLHDDPEDDRTSYGHDTWKVDTEGLSLRDDPDDPNHEYGFKYHPNGIKPERLTLHHMAAIDDESISHQDSFRQPLHVHFTDQGTVGNRTHITREDRGLVPIEMVRHMLGAMGEKPGEHRNRQGEDWESFKDDVKRNGIQNPLFITVDHNEAPRLAEGNHRRDAAVELGHTHVPVQVRYFGHAEQQGTLEERHRSAVA